MSKDLMSKANMVRLVCKIARPFRFQFVKSAQYGKDCFAKENSSFMTYATFKFMCCDVNTLKKFSDKIKSAVHIFREITERKNTEKARNLMLVWEVISAYANNSSYEDIFSKILTFWKHNIKQNGLVLETNVVWPKNTEHN